MDVRTIKLTLVGAGGVGKSSISSRLVTGSFVEKKMTVGLDIDTWSLLDHSTGTEVRTSMFDLGGQEHFRFFQEELISGSKLVLLVFDVARASTFFRLDEWLPLLEKIPPHCWILVANKIDQHFTVTEETIKQRATDLGNVTYCLVSTKTGEGFDNLIEMIQTKLDVVCEN